MHFLNFSPLKRKVFILVTLPYFLSVNLFCWFEINQHSRVLFFVRFKSATLGPLNLLIFNGAVQTMNSTGFCDSMCLSGNLMEIHICHTGNQCPNHVTIRSAVHIFYHSEPIAA
jgi:hypothetical protein